MAKAYFNEIDRDAVHVLRSLIANGLIADGDVDDRSIVDVRPDDLVGYTQCHFFAGAGVWSVAARIAGWPDDRPLWTGSCPCQPFSAAGRGLGTDDPRHLWPDFFRLIRECRPPVIFGEQVATAAGKRNAIDEDMHSMWRGEDLSGFLPHQGISRQFDWLSCEMQNLLPGMAAELSDWLEGAEVGFFPQVPGEEPRFHSGIGRSLSGEASRFGVRSGRLDASASGQDRRGPMRDVRSAIQVGWRPNLGQPVARPDHPGTWLHDHERSGGPLCSERDDEHVGGGAGPSDCRVNERGAREGRWQPAGPMGTTTEGAPSLDWLDGVAADLDTIGYSLGSPDIPACAVDAPHIRQRLWWCSVANGQGIDGRSGRRIGDEAGDRIGQPANRYCPACGGRGRIGPLFPGGISSRCANCSMGDTERRGRDGARLPDGAGQEVPKLAGTDGREAVRAEGAMVHPAGVGRREGRAEHELRRGRATSAVADASGVTLGDAFGSGLEGQCGDGDDGRGWPEAPRPVASPDGRNGSAWAGADWILCRDGKARRTQPGIRLLVDGMAGRVPAWRLAGNSISPVLAAEVISAFLETEHLTEPRP